MARFTGVVSCLAVFALLNAALGQATTVQVTNICADNSCLVDVPAACGGLCYLTPAKGDLSYCAAKCIAALNATSTQNCLASTAVGTYYLEEAQSLVDTCTAIATAAAVKTAAEKNITTAFPCTANVTGLDYVALQSCSPTVCTTACQGQLSLLTTACQNSIAAASTSFASAIKTCTTVAAAPSISNTGGTTGTTGSTLNPITGLPSTTSDNTTVPSSGSGSGNGAASLQVSAVLLTAATAVVATALLL